MNSKQNVVSKENIEKTILETDEQGEDKYLVTEKSVRLDGGQGKCHFCGQAISEHHKPECETIRKTVTMYVAYAFHIPVPNFTDDENMDKVAGKIYGEVDKLLLNKFYTDERLDHEECYPFDSEWEVSEESFLNEAFDQPKPVVVWP